MAKMICHMRNGYSFCHPRTGLIVPATAGEVEVNEWQASELRQDCRVIVLESMPTPAESADEGQLAEVAATEQAPEVKAKQPAGKKRKAGRRG